MNNFHNQRSDFHNSSSGENASSARPGRPIAINVLVTMNAAAESINTSHLIYELRIFY